MDNYYNLHASSPVCRWHQNQNIVALCSTCGSFTCEKCSLPTPDRRHLCPDCFKTEYEALLNETRQMKSTATLFVALGIISTLFLYMISIFLLLKKADASSVTLNLNTVTVAFQEFTNGSVLITAFYIIGFLFQLFCSIGFFFGMRRVVRSLRKLPGCVIVFSIFFFAIVLGLILQISWLIGGFIMIGDYRKIHKNNIILADMEHTLSIYRI